MEDKIFSIQEFNRKAFECSNHRMVMTSSEQLYANKYDESHGINPVGQRVTYTCQGSCKQSIVKEFKN